MHKTEMRNKNTINIDKVSTNEMLNIIRAENYNAVKAIEPAMADITKACDMITERMKKAEELYT